MKQRPFAAFDIDGTVVRWQLYHATADELARRGHIDPIQFEKIREIRMQWKQRAPGVSFDTYERALVNIFTSALTSISPDDIREAGASVLAEYKDQVYTYTRELIKALKAKDYLLFAISGSQVEIVELLANYYGFDDYAGTTYEVSGGVYTGKSDVIRRERKPEILKQLADKHNASWQDSIAVGDSESDIPMLSAVEQPIAFNPSRDLFQHAKEQGWQVVLERKNMVYRLEPRDGSYLLA